MDLLSLRRTLRGLRTSLCNPLSLTPTETWRLLCCSCFNNVGNFFFFLWKWHLSEQRLILEAFHLFKAFFPQGRAHLNSPQGRSGLTNLLLNPVRENFHGPSRVQLFIHGIFLAFCLWFGHRVLDVCVFLRCTKTMWIRALAKRRENMCFSWWSLIHLSAAIELQPEAISSMKSPGHRPTQRHF